MNDRSRVEEVLEEARHKIALHGWIVVGVMGEGVPPFFYTAGLTQFGHPEFILYAGLPPEIAKDFLNDMGERVRKGRKFVDGDRVDDLAAAPVAFREVAWERTLDARLSVAEAIYGRECIGLGAIQIVLQDTEGRFPWDEGYSLTSQVLLA